MFRLKMEFESLREFNEVIGFWGQGAKNFEDFTEEEIDYLEACIEDYDFTSPTQVNDFMWFDAPDLIEEMHNEEDDAE